MIRQLARWLTGRDSTGPQGMHDSFTVIAPLPKSEKQINAEWRGSYTAQFKFPDDSPNSTAKPPGAPDAVNPQTGETLHILRTDDK